NGDTTVADFAIDGSSVVSMGSNVVTNVATPVAGTDAANMDYVDSVSSSGFTLIDDSAASATIAGGDTLTINGTANEVNVAVTTDSGTADGLTIGLPDNVVVAGTLGSGGLATLSSLAVTNNTDLTGTLDVTGTTDLGILGTSGLATLQSTVVTTSATIGTTLGVTGDTTLTGALTANGGTTTTTLTASGLTDLNGALEVAGTSDFTGVVTAVDIDSATLDATGNVTVGGTLGVTGNTTMNSNVTISGGVGETFTITNGVATTVYEIDTSNGNVSANGTMTIAGDADLNGATTMGDLTIDASSAISMGGNIVANVTDPVADQDAATKKYVDDTASAGWTLSDGSNTQVVSGGETFTIEGTDDEVDVVVSFEDTLTIGLPNDVTITNDLTVTAGTTTDTLSVTNATTLNSQVTMVGGSGESFIINDGAGTPAIKFSVDSLNGNTVVEGTLAVTGAVTAPAITASGLIDANAGVTATTVTVEDLDIAGVVYVGAGGVLTTEAGFGYNASTDTLTAVNMTAATALVSSGTLGVTGISTLAQTNATNITASGTLGVTGTSTLSTTNITGVATVTGSAAIDNITIDGNAIDVTAGTELVINELGNDVDFRIEGDTNANLVFVDAGTESVNIGVATPVTNVQFQVGGDNAVILSKGTTAQRPVVGVAGMLRYNTSNDNYEYFDGDTSSWAEFGVEFTVIASETFNGDTSTTAFTLGSTQTTASCIVSINGVVQLPVTAYGVSGTTLTFTEPPATGDVIEVREITTTTTMTSLNNGSSTAVVEALTGQGVVEITGDLLPSADVTYDLGSASKQWKDLHLDGTTIYLGGLLIKNDAGTFKFLEADGFTPAPVDLGTTLDPDIIVDGGTY
ncbi:MAG: hypothetical protein DRI98_13135, partial [Bacteroidetes bacterium]